MLIAATQQTLYKFLQTLKLYQTMFNQVLLVILTTLLSKMGMKHTFPWFSAAIYVLSTLIGVGATSPIFDSVFAVAFSVADALSGAWLIEGFSVLLHTFDNHFGAFSLAPLIDFILETFEIVQWLIWILFFSGLQYYLLSFLQAPTFLIFVFEFCILFFPFIYNSFVVAIMVTNFVSKFLLGVRITPTPRIVRMRFVAFMNFVDQFIRAVPEIRMYISYSISSFIYLNYTVMKLPVDIAALILQETHFKGPGTGYYILCRFFFGISLVVTRVLLLGVQWLIGLQLAIVIFPSFIFLASNGYGFLSSLFFLSKIIIVVCIVPLRRFIPTTISKEQKHLVKALLRVRILVGRPLHRLNEKQQIILLDPSNVDSLSPEGIRNTFIDLARNTNKFALPLFYLFCLYHIFKRFVKLLVSITGTVIIAPLFLLELVVLFSIPFFIPNFCYDNLYFYGLKFFSFYTRLDMHGYFKRFVRMIGLGYMIGLSYISGPLQDSEHMAGGGVDAVHVSQIYVRTFISLTRRSVLKFIERLDNIRLPEMVQASYSPPDLESIRSTYVTLQGVGFPVQQSFIDSLSAPEGSSYLSEWGSFKNWMIGTSNFSLGFRDITVGVHKWLPANFFPEVPGYIHTTTFTGVPEEIKSTARYWTGNHTLNEYPDGDPQSFDKMVDDLWEVVHPQYENSQLSTFNEIFARWTKRFNMGFGFGKPSPVGAKLRQATRQAVIDSMGGKKPFLAAWGKVFNLAKTLVMPSPVFTKWESLKESKSINRAVRTVVGSAFVEYVMTTVFNFKPNHNYKIWEMPAKVGMPINGQNFNRLWESMLGHSKVWAGDMTAFDSSQAPILLRTVAAIRKKGYHHHADYLKIADLIDVAYENLISNPMGFKNFGDIAIKAQGATTGHASTTPDNTMMLLANYLYAWRRVTGLRAREFLNFNTLANFGDDHILAYDEVFGWSPQKAIAAMAELGTIMRDESPGQDFMPRVDRPMPSGVNDWRDCKFAFLSKQPLPLTPEITSELAAAGVTIPLTYATCHTKARLLGKIKGQVTRAKFSNPRNSYDAFLSYMYLTAHHKDVYDALEPEATQTYLRVRGAMLKNGENVSKLHKPPTYNKVLQQWYAAEPFPYALPTEDENAQSDEFFIELHKAPDAMSTLIRWLSDIPSLLSPRYRNVRYADWLQGKLADHLSWPLTFISMANNTENNLLSSKLLLTRTPYAFLRNDAIVLREDRYSSLVVRHWLFMVYQRSFQSRKWFTPLDLIRVFDHAFVNFLFIFTGQVTQILVELDLHILDTVVIVLLSKINMPFDIPVLQIIVRAPSVILGIAISRLLSWFQPAGAIDFQPLDEQVRWLSHGGDASFVLSAPTGVGKSTRMMHRIRTSTKRKVIVIAPRRLVAIETSKYMQSLYPSSGIGISTEGYTPSPSDTLVYCTAQSFLASPLLQDPENIIVLDEAHIDEPVYHVLINFFEINKLRVIYMTATPPNYIKAPLLEVPAVSTFNINERQTSCKSLSDYYKVCAEFANDRLVFEKILIFVPTLKAIDIVAGNVSHKVCRLSSIHTFVDPTATVYISTSVADAGVTIPDVSFVLSPNVDIFVSKPDNVDSKDVITYYYLLSPLTIRQRRGRTGRTSDGVFVLFSIDDVETSPKVYSFMDYVLGTRPSTRTSLSYFPPRFKDVVTPGMLVAAGLSDLAVKDYKEIVEIKNKVDLGKFDVGEFIREKVMEVIDTGLRRGVSSRDPNRTLLEEWGLEEIASIRANYRTFRNDFVKKMGYDVKVGVTEASEFALARDVEVPLEEDPNIIVKTKPAVPIVIEQVPPKKKQATLSFGAKPKPASSATTEAPVKKKQATLSFGSTKKPASHFASRPAPKEKTRVNVSGSGLLCGVRCVQGIIFTCRRVLLSEQLLHQQMIDLTRRAGLDELIQLDFFNLEVLRDLLFYGYRIKVTFYVEGVKTPDPTFFTRHAVSGALYLGTFAYLDGAHYNYQGYPVTGQPEDSKLPEVYFNDPILDD